MRAAIQEANDTPDVDLIRFFIQDGGNGVKTIDVGSLGFGALPSITAPVTIDGYTQPGSSPNTLARGTNAQLMIELNGTNAGFNNGLTIDAGGSGSVVRGLVINRFRNQGIQTESNGPTNLRIEGNFVGTDPSGTIALGNKGDGMEIDASNSTVGGSTPDKRNLISGNAIDGLSISEAHNARVLGNLIGTKRDGVSALGNGFNGVDVSGDVTGNRVLRNSISFNGRLGIDLGVDGRTTNDTGDADSGANGLQNFPVITSAKTVSGKTTLAGKLNSLREAGYLVPFFSNPSSNEDKKFIGQKSVTTDGSANASFTFSPATAVAAGQTITATATDPAGNTSEFSAPKTVGSSTLSAPNTTKVSGPSGTSRSTSATFRFKSSAPNATFECKRDGRSYRACSSPKRIHGLSEGRHVFRVRAVDADGNVDPTPAVWRWRVNKR